MKKFLLTMLPFVLWSLLLMVAFPIAVDPYNVFHLESIRDNGIEPNKNYIKTEYVSRHPDYFDAFIFGSSRVSSIHSDKVEGYRFYNMTYSEGVPEEHRQNLQVMLDRGVCPKLVMVGVDSISFLIDPQLHKGDLLRGPYPMNLKEKAKFFLNYLEPVMVMDSLETTFFEPRSVSYEQNFYTAGWTLDYGMHPATDWSRAEADWNVRYANRTPQVLEEIRQLKQLCDEHSIQLIIFTNPMHPLTFAKAVENGYMDFLAGLVQITDFYNFSGYNDITLNNDNFLETSHYKAEVGDMILDVIFSGKRDEHLEEQGFGMVVTRENYPVFLERIVPAVP